MDQSIIEKIFNQNKLGAVKSIDKLDIWFTNTVYCINDNFILKVCTKTENECNFQKEFFFLNLYKDKIPVPKIIHYDNTKKIYHKNYLLYFKVHGDNLYSKWHLMSDTDRKKIIKQLCEILKTINNTPYEHFIEYFKLHSSINWENEIDFKITNLLQDIESQKLLSNEFIKKIRDYVKENKYVLADQKTVLVYWDAHFDNILIKDNKIIAILDFERTDLASIDFVLDIVKRMSEHPNHYISRKYAKYAKKEDYKNLLKRYKKFYPELFEFNNLDIRLDLYLIEHVLKNILDQSDVVYFKQRIAKIVKYKL